LVGKMEKIGRKVKDEDSDWNALTINFESKLAEAVVLNVGGQISVGGVYKRLKDITIDYYVLPTKSLLNHQK